MILITGSAGFIGFHLAEFYLKRNIQVVGIDNLNNYYDPRIKKNRLKILKKNKNFIFLKIDLKKGESFKKLNKYRKKIKFVIHLAGQAGVRYSISNPLTYIKNNIEGYINLLEYFKFQKNLKCIFYASSSSIYGEQKKITNKDNMISIYAVSKKTLEQISSVYNHLYGMKFFGMRFFTVYGPYGRPDMSVYKFFNKISKNKSIEIYNRGNHFRSFTYISDIVDNINRLLLYVKKFKNKKFNEVINIGNPKSVDLRYVVNLIEKNFKKKIKKKFLPLQMGDIIKTRANVKKEQIKYKFNFEINIDKGIEKFAKWYFNEK